MKNFSCIVFINKKLKQFSFDSLVYDGEYYYLPQELVGTKTNLILPIVKIDGEWWIKNFNCELETKADVSENTIADEHLTIDSKSDYTENYSENKIKIGIKIFSELAKEKAIEHYDYIFVENYEDHLIFNVLFLENNQLDLNGKFYNLTEKNITVGRSSDCEIYIKANESISRQHALIAKDNEGNYRIESIKNKPNFYVNGLLEKSKILSFGDTIEILDSKILFLENQICVFGNLTVNSLTETKELSLASIKREKTKRNWFIRTPRIISGFTTKPVEIDMPPPTQKSKPMPAILTIGPSLTMSMVMMVSLGVTITNVTSGGSLSSLITSGALALSMLLGAILWPTLTRRYQKNKEKASESLRVNAYNEYIGDLRKKLQDDNEKNKKLLNEVFLPAPVTIDKIVKDEKLSRRIFEKTSNDVDFLSVRLGSGKVLSSIPVITQKTGFSIDKDLLAKLPKELEDEFKYIDNLPLQLSLLENKTIGIIGSQQKIDILIKTIFMSLTFGHSYDEVKTIFIYKNDEHNNFELFRSVLHSKTDNTENRYVATTKDEVQQLFSFLAEQQEAARQLKTAEDKKDMLQPFYVFFVFDRDLIEGEPFTKKLENAGTEDNFSTFFVYKNISKLPKECNVIIQADNETTGYFSKIAKENKFEKFSLDNMTDSIFENYIRYLQNIRIKLPGKTANIPERVSFLGMYKVGNIEKLNIKKRWEENCSYKSLAAPIGLKSGGEVFSLNIHENFHGPHGLAAGMTGSGKSELLQAFILSMGINFHPDNVSFIIIDYKGGGMANSFIGMPHLAGTITNLSGSILRRALISIDSELKRRQYLFALAGVNNIDKYQKLFNEGRATKPLPHLVIIADEFAQLKTQQPDFMRKIIDIAQIGRSLGVHLLLATQKPAGVVDDQIWGNSRFKICLKVLDRQDSQEMIKKPDAAMIKLPGRCYVQVGYDEIYEYVQSGYSGAPYVPMEEYVDEEDRVVTMVDSFGSVTRKGKLKQGYTKENKTQLEALVSYFKEIAVSENIKPNTLWLNPLDTKIYLQDIENPNENFNGQKWFYQSCKLSVPVGFADYPEQQEQKPIEADFSKGSLAVYGGPSSGKTTFLQTLLFNLALKNSPENLNMYIFDFGSRVLSCFAKMPHTKSILFSDQPDGIKQVIAQILNILNERQKLFGQKGVTSFDSFNKSSDTKIPAIIIAIDNYSVVTERYNLEMGDHLVKIAREGSGYGIYLAVTGSNKAAVYYRVSDYINNNFALRQSDINSYRDILKVAVSFEPEEAQGRGLAVDNKKVIEFQTALCYKSDNEIERNDYIKSVAEKMQKVSSKTGTTVKPEKIIKEVETKKSYFEISGNADEYMIVGKNADKKLFGFKDGFKTLIITNFEQEKSDEALKTIIQNILANKKGDVYIFDIYDKIKLNSGEKFYNQDTISKGIAAIKSLKKESKVFVAINNLLKFYEFITEEDAMILSDFVESHKNISYILTDSVINLSTMSFTPFFNSITRDKKLNRFLLGGQSLNSKDTIFEEILLISKMSALDKNHLYAIDQTNIESIICNSASVK